MPGPKHTISRVDSSDLPFLANFIFSAKLSLSINRLLYQPWPNQAIQHEQYTRAVEGAYADSAMECFKATDDDSNAIIGYIVFERKTATKGDSAAPGQSKTSGTTSGGNTPKGMNPGVLAEVSAANIDIRKAIENIDRYGMSSVLWNLNEFFANIRIRINVQNSFTCALSHPPRDKVLAPGWSSLDLIGLEQRVSHLQSQPKPLRMVSSIPWDSKKQDTWILIYVNTRRQIVGSVFSGLLVWFGSLDLVLLHGAVIWGGMAGCRMETVFGIMFLSIQILAKGTSF